jgi:hypothetical protein
MTEQELIDLSFEKVEITDHDSQNGYDYYYYYRELCSGVELHSTDNIDVKDDHWVLKSFDIPAVEIKTKEHYMQFLEVMNSIIC